MDYRKLAREILKNVAVPDVTPPALPRTISTESDDERIARIVFDEMTEKKEETANASQRYIA